MATTTYKQLVQDCTNAYRAASDTTDKVKVGELANKVKTLENVTEETAVQTPLIQDITENLTGKIQEANARPETIKKGFKAYVGQKLIEGTYVPKGMEDSNLYHQIASATAAQDGQVLDVSQIMNALETFGTDLHNNEKGALFISRCYSGSEDICNHDNVVLQLMYFINTTSDSSDGYSTVTVMNTNNTAETMYDIDVMIDGDFSLSCNTYSGQAFFEGVYDIWAIPDLTPYSWLEII